MWQILLLSTYNIIVHWISRAITLFAIFNPTYLPSQSPSIEPTGAPTTGQPSSLPSYQPTLLPSVSPTSAPTFTPTKQPTNSFAPTAFGKHRTEFAYRITVLEYDANDIRTGDNNTIEDDLITATSVVVQRVLATGDPCAPIFFNRLRSRRMSSGSWMQNIVHPLYSYTNEESEREEVDDNNNNKEEAEYRDYAPVEMLSVIDVDCQGSAAALQLGNQDLNCILIRSAVTIYCDEGEDCEAVQSEVIDGIRDSIENGCFFKAMPPQ